MPIKHWLYPLVIVGLPILGSGCGGPPPLYPTAGTVTFKGVPVAGANVTFLPREADGEAAVAVTDAAGRFEMTTGIRGSGARQGKYTVLIAKLDLPAGKPEEAAKQSLGMALKPHDLLPPRYTDPNQTPFKDVDVPSGGKTDFVFALQEVR